MSLTQVSTNIEAQQAYHAMQKINSNLADTQLRMATGKKINSTEDDPAGYQLARGLERRQRGLEVALSNVSSAKSILNVAEGGYQNIMDILQEMNDQVSALIAEIGDIVDETTFNGDSLIDGAYSGNFQVGESAANTMTISLNSASAASLSVNSIDLSSASAANTAITTLESAIDTLSGRIQDIGEYKARLSFNENTVSVAITNTESVLSNIEDADLVQEQMNLMKYQILQQTSASAFVQANTAPQLVLQLMK
jgi:flagellin